MSVHDGQRISEHLGDVGYHLADDPSSADVIVLTTCSVREKAHQKVLSAIGRFKRFKDRRPSLIIVVAGCVAQQEGSRLFKAAPHIDLVVGTDHLWRIPTLISMIRELGEPQCFVGFDDSDHERFLSLGSASPNKFPTDYLTIQKGCDERCAFCIVPQVRGPAECRPVDEILGETAALVDRGVREIVLLGQTVNSYLWQDVGFARLLTLLDQIPGVLRVRYESAHPRFLTDELIEAHETLPSLCEHLHLPAQSGSDAVLRRMGRGHTRGEFLNWIGGLRAISRGVGVTTDMFVGFPGETESDFQETLSLVEAVRFDGAYTFKYSPRPGTRAAGWIDDVPYEVKVDRLRRLQDLQVTVTREHLASLVGTEVEVLIEGESKAGGGQLRGRSRRGSVVNIDPPKVGPDGSTDCVVACVGELVMVDVTGAGSHSVTGRIKSDDRAGGEI